MCRRLAGRGRRDPRRGPDRRGRRRGGLRLAVGARAHLHPTGRAGRHHRRARRRAAGVLRRGGVRGTDAIGDAGIYPPAPPVIGEVIPETPAEAAGIAVGDRIVGVERNARRQPPGSRRHGAGGRGPRDHPDGRTRGPRGPAAGHAGDPGGPGDRRALFARRRDLPPPLPPGPGAIGIRRDRRGGGGDRPLGRAHRPPTGTAGGRRGLRCASSPGRSASPRPPGKRSAGDRWMC